MNFGTEIDGVLFHTLANFSLAILHNPTRVLLVIVISNIKQRCRASSKRHT